ncbi:hypothetical protein TELCIR_09034 [Teladorsagia circumcincta]|uniref:Protein kinase domain-containing protein n=1 Tax=Teladorsagia circumcincta TaxID=45464 RepID=A0A2G9UFZ1_TELCI|nr:hypothetical protein TELCIR_09034 [Teladorsagia circumcincta]
MPTPDGHHEGKEIGEMQEVAAAIHEVLINVSKFRWIEVHLLHINDYGCEHSGNRVALYGTAASAVRHPHLSRCLSVLAPSSSKIVLVSEYYEKGTLLELILREQRLKEVPQGVRMFRQLMEAVHYLHERNIVHR